MCLGAHCTYGIGSVVYCIHSSYGVTYLSNLNVMQAALCVREIQDSTLLLNMHVTAPIPNAVAVMTPPSAD